jgi:transcriptional regulator with XRE-family HTH domain
MREWLKNLRKQNNITQSDMADLLGISQNHYSNIENGARAPRLTLLFASQISDIFDIPLSKIRNYEEALQK